MIYARIRGGLGNQLFQYCAARTLADQLGVSLGLDIREFGYNSPYEMSLKYFNIRANFNPPELIKQKKDGKIAFIFDKLVGNQKNVYKEKSLMFNNNLFSKVDGTYLKGYWQSEKYFIENKKNILKDISFIKSPDKLNLSNLKEIKNTSSVSLHIRRGDYVTNSTYNSIHGICDLRYYMKAIEYFIDKLGMGIKVFVFSDDPNWVIENLKLPVDVRFINNNSTKHSYEDLRLMLNCDHNIIANSSFSWWGAWLNQNPNKIVISPKKWFADPQIYNNDIIPDGWLRY
ncbi:alpha-1,2-fucosyltransferase [Amylibacter sp.]|nr:alpha-1,2-fucosyltransferase [Amylibacter sp.]